MIALLPLAGTEVCTDAAVDPYVYRLSKIARQSGVTPFHRFHGEAGIERVRADDMDGAAAHFRAAAHFASYSPDKWRNLGQAYSAQAVRRAVWDAEALRLLREAVACFDLSYWLSATPEARGGRSEVLQLLQANHVQDTCPIDDCALYETMLRVAQAKSLDAALIRRFCTTKNLKVRTGADERVRGFASAQSLRLSWLALKVCGVAVIEGAVAPEAAHAAGRAVAAHFETIKARIHAFKPEILDPSSPYSGNTSIQTVWPDAAERSKLRFEVKLPMEPPYLDEALTSSEPVLSLAKAALRSGRLELDSLSYVVSMAGAPAQHWHQDVEPLIHNWSGEQLPPHGVVAMVALGAVTKAGGPTEFVLGSHIASLERAKAGLPKVAFAVNEGGVVLFDFRIEHRGGANKSPKDRALLVVPYVHEWWRDAINFNTPQTVGWDRHNTTRARKLFKRLDSHAWTSTLETLLAAQGVDLDALRSTFHPHPSTDLYV
jgi:ectoine hydroxylase-related dioxygenase (phytanoyl-CoA dioxygenase family)